MLVLWFIIFVDTGFRGYVLNVSNIRCSPSKVKYFKAVLDDGSNEAALISYNPELHSNLKSAVNTEKIFKVSDFVLLSYALVLKLRLKDWKRKWNIAFPKKVSKFEFCSCNFCYSFQPLSKTNRIRGLKWRWHLASGKSIVQ